MRPCWLTMTTASGAAFEEDAELGLDSAALGCVAARGGDDDAVGRRDGAEADLGGELRAVLAQGEELEAGAHGARARRGEVGGAVPRVAVAVARGDEDFDRLALQVLAGVAEEDARPGP